MVLNREQAARAAEASQINVPAACQAWTRGIFDAPSVGDVDRDGDADAVDGWKSEAVHNKHGDRNPPRGVPVAWSGGSHGFGHRAVSLGGGMIRSTDAGGRGRVATVPLNWFEEHWGLRYLGWSETISGLAIPLPPPPPATRVSKFLASGPGYDLALLDSAIKAGRVGKVRKVRNAIDKEVHRLPGDEHSTRVDFFLDSYHKDRQLRLHLLFDAVHTGGRHGTVRSVFVNLHELIDQLPKR